MLRYREETRRPSQYLSQYKSYQNATLNCPGSCSCDFGTRTNYDRMQYGTYVQGKPDQLPVVFEIAGWK
jgi:hypothetical protein